MEFLEFLFLGFFDLKSVGLRLVTNVFLNHFPLFLKIQAYNHVSWFEFDIESSYIYDISCMLVLPGVCS